MRRSSYGSMTAAEAVSVCRAQMVVRPRATRRSFGRRPLGSTAVPYVYAFDHKHRRPPMDMKDLLGGKGANLAEMTSVLRLPVPPGFTISTDACRAYLRGGWPAELDAEIARHVKVLEKRI